jgi:hypothetical protein
MSMIEVTKEKFFKVIGPMSVHPRPEPECSMWESLNTREIVGKSEPGYKSRFGTPHRYWLKEGFASR